MGTVKMIKHEGEGNVYCRWLHFSDLHICNSVEGFWGDILYGTRDEQEEPIKQKNAEETMKLYGLKGMCRFYPVDAIVITGDFVNRGDFSKDKRDHIKKILQKLYKVCAENIPEWNEDGKQWEAGMPMERLFFCPGNHDVIRDAVLTDTTYGHTVERKKIIIEEATCKAGCFNEAIEEDKISVLTEYSFGPFYNLIDEICGVKSSGVQGDIFALVPSESSNTAVLFCALNTALLAGQPKKVTEEEIEEKRSAWEKADKKGDRETAIELYKEWCELADAADGKVIVDEEKLCMPSKAYLDEQEKQIKKWPQAHVCIAVGHHGYDFLSKDAKNQFISFARGIGAHVYLCGHAHKTGQDSYEIGTLYGNCIRQYVAGAMFYDPNDTYSELGFYIGTIVKNGDGFESQQVMWVYSKRWRDWHSEEGPVAELKKRTVLTDLSSGSSNEQKETATGMDTVEKDAVEKDEVEKDEVEKNVENSEGKYIEYRTIETDVDPIKPKEKKGSYGLEDGNSSRLVKLMGW